jgi:hypothetical protein
MLEMGRECCKDVRVEARIMPRRAHGTRMTETKRERDAFIAFFGMGPKRTLTALSKQLDIPMSTLSQWKTRWKWDERIEHGGGAELLANVEDRPAPRVRDRAIVNYLMVTHHLGKALKHEELKDGLKMEFMAAYWIAAGNAAWACRKVGITYKTYQFWRMNDPDFAEMVRLVDEARHDYVETALMKKISEGDITAITFYLKNRRPEQWNEKRFDKPINISLNATQAAVAKDIIEHGRDNQYMRSVATILKEIGVLDGYEPDAPPGLPGGDERGLCAPATESAADEVCSASADAAPGGLSDSSAQ